MITIASLSTALLLSLGASGPTQDAANPDEIPVAEKAQADTPPPEVVPPTETPKAGPKKASRPRPDIRAILEQRHAVLTRALRLDAGQQEELTRLLELELQRYVAAEALRNGGSPGKADPRRGARTPRSGRAAAGTKQTRRPPGAAPGRGARTGGGPTEDPPPGPAAGRGVLSAGATKGEAEAPEATPADPAPGPGAPPAFGILGGKGVHPALQGLRFTTVDALLRCLRPGQIGPFGAMVGAQGVLQLRQLAAARRVLSPRIPAGLKAGTGQKKRGGGGGRGKKRGGQRGGGGGRGGGRGGGLL